jgi:ABC-type phosphate/phosphonate transport system permease subunit
MFAVDEDIGGAINNTSNSFNEWGKLSLILILVIVVVLAVFSLVMYFVRRRILKNDRPDKFTLP